MIADEIRIKDRSATPRYAEMDGGCLHCDGVYRLARQGDCSCHIVPPCAACEFAPLICEKCGDEVHPID